jgi:curved DNA-binding protein CbpA
MPALRFRGNPYEVLGVGRDATSGAIKRRWRELAREHHPDRAAGDAAAAATLTARMARINAAYDLLSDPLRRAHWDASTDGLAYERDSAARKASFDAEKGEDGPAGPPPPRPTRPVTARFDTTPVFHPLNATLSSEPYRPAGKEAPPRKTGYNEPLRASTPTGPVERQPGMPGHMPTLRESRETELGFGKFRGYTLGEVALIEPTYIDWIARTITRDRDVVLKARVVQADLDERGIERAVRPTTPFWGRGDSADQP